MSTNNTKKHSSPGNLRYLKAEGITPKDDTFHGCRNIIDIEWWYFDAVFDNDYSIHIGFRVYHIKNIGLLQTRINLYYKGKSISEVITRDVFKKDIIDTKFPSIQLSGKPVVSFDRIQYKNSNKFRYIIDLKVKHIHADLIFEGTTTGWKIETPSTCWTVPLPKANVSGTIHFKDKTILVQGIGYHDHNWGYSPTTVIQNIGWYWGRITSDKLNVTWANTIESKEKQDFLAVINRDSLSGNQPEYINVNPRNLCFQPGDIQKNHGKRIPTSFLLQFDQPAEKNNPTIAADLSMKTIDIQYSRIFIIHYWRYHIETSGFIQFENNREDLYNRPQIIEFLSFKNPSTPKR